MNTKAETIFLSPNLIHLQFLGNLFDLDRTSTVLPIFAIFNSMFYTSEIRF